MKMKMMKLFFSESEQNKQIFARMREYERVCDCANKFLLDILYDDEMLMCHIYFIEFCV